ncbi:hypothetical protein IAT40_007599 [Kwoniella sp. CBS 6097]
MRFPFVDRQILAILGMLITPSITSMAGAVASPPHDIGSDASVRPRGDVNEDMKDYLSDNAGPVIQDVIKSGGWDSHWLNAVLGSLVWTDPSSLASVWDGEPVWGGPENVDGGGKHKFYLYNQKGAKQGIEVDFEEIEDEADQGPDQHLWLPGIQMAFTKLGGILGADKEQIAWGSPVDAFKVLTNKTAVIEQVTSEDEDKFWGYMEKAATMPVIFGVGEDPDNKEFFWPWKWYTALRMDLEKEKLEFWEAVKGETLTPKKSEVWKDVRKVVYCEECQVKP